VLTAYEMQLLSISKFLFVVSIFTSTAFSGEYSFDKALGNAKSRSLTLPKKEEDGRVRTLNRKGSMFQSQDLASRAVKSS
jgi:hypothetical protein